MVPETEEIRGVLSCRVLSNKYVYMGANEGAAWRRLALTNNIHVNVFIVFLKKVDIE